MLNNQEMQELLSILSEALTDAESILEDAEEVGDEDYLTETEEWVDRLTNARDLIASRLGKEREDSEN